MIFLFYRELGERSLFDVNNAFLEDHSGDSFWSPSIMDIHSHLSVYNKSLISCKFVQRVAVGVFQREGSIFNEGVMQMESGWIWLQFWEDVYTTFFIVGKLVLWIFVLLCSAVHVQSWSCFILSMVLLGNRFFAAQGCCGRNSCPPLSWGKANGSENHWGFKW